MNQFGLARCLASLLFVSTVSPVLFASNSEPDFYQASTNVEGVLGGLIHLICLLTIVVGGVFLLMGCFSLYARLIKKKSNGKPVSNHVVMTLVGVVFVFIPIIFLKTLKKSNKSMAYNSDIQVLRGSA